MTPLRRPTVLLADDHVAFVDVIARLIDGRFEVVGKVTDGDSLLEAASRLQPDVIVSDISMPSLDGFEGLRLLQGTGSRLIFLTMHADPRLALEALKLGACGFLLKHHSGGELVHAIEVVLQGQKYVTPTLTAGMVALSTRVTARTES